MARRLLTVLSLMLLVAAGGAARAQETFPVEALTIRTAAGGEYRLAVEIARTPGQMAQGLMFRDRLEPDRGMLFIHDGDVQATMWMKNTLIPLDMLFIDRTGRIVHIHERAEPRSLATIAAPVPVRAVLEILGGMTARLGIRKGDRVIHPAFEGAGG